MGFFYRTIRIVENGIKPAYVFDGKPPELKAGVVRVVLPFLQPPCSPVGPLTVRASAAGKTVRKARRGKGRRRGGQGDRSVWDSLKLRATTYRVRAAGTTEDVDRFSRRTVKVTREHNEECRRLLKLMGIPVVIV